MRCVIESMTSDADPVDRRRVEGRDVAVLCIARVRLSIQAFPGSDEDV